MLPSGTATAASHCHKAEAACGPGKVVVGPLGGFSLYAAGSWRNDGALAIPVEGFSSLSRGGARYWGHGSDPQQLGFQGHFGSDQYFTTLTMVFEHIGHSKVRLS
jgi:hypothetical protein